MHICRLTPIFSFPYHLDLKINPSLKRNICSPNNHMFLVNKDILVYELYVCLHILLRIFSYLQRNQPKLCYQPSLTDLLFLGILKTKHLYLKLTI